MWTVEDIVKVTRGQLVHGDPKGSITGWSTDTRTLRPGDLFVALHGPRYDGHAFVRLAMDRGAAGALVRTRPTADLLAPTAAVIQVEDTLTALQSAAAFHREQFPIPMAAVTGSNGKTTVKEMIGSILRLRAGAESVLVTEGNLNNHIGVPLTLLRLRDHHRAAVIEMGINHAGELMRLCGIAQPTLGLITNIGPTHLEHLKTEEGVREAKAELLDWLRRHRFSGTAPLAILNRDDPHFGPLAARVGNRFVGFGFDTEADVRIEAFATAPSGSRFRLRLGLPSADRALIEIILPAAGRHQASNAAAAAAAAVLLGAAPEEVREGLARFRPVSMRGQRIEWHGATVVNDAYNANPASVVAAIEAAAALNGPGCTIAVLGDMLELGAAAAEAHREVGRKTAELGVRLLLAMGPQSHDLVEGANAVRPGMAYHYGEPAALADAIKSGVRAGDVILVKGSRGIRMERVLEALGVSNEGNA
jgi:UDP-N-acetylmuramoyl-tripeptide--D-alanyl-D-alanine ligase